MTNINVIENKISAVKKYLKILEHFEKYSLKEITTDIMIQGAVERYLHLAIQACLDLSEAVISFKNFRKPTTLAENFHVLSEENIIDNHLTQELSKMAGFRNIIVHDYEDVDYKIVYDILQNRLKDIEQFVKIIEKVI